MPKREWRTCFLPDAGRFLGDALRAFAAIKKQREYYLACSKANVLVHWSQTSVGPKYWMGPG